MIAFGPKAKSRQVSLRPAHWAIADKRLRLGSSLRHNEGRVDGRKIRVALSGNIQEARSVVGSGVCSLPAQPAFDFASVDAQIAEHVIIHFGEFGHGAADCQFCFDRPLHFRQERDNLRDKEPRDKT